MNTSLATGRPLCVSGAIVEWTLSIDLLLFMEEVQMINAENSRPKALEVCASIQIHQSGYQDCCQFRTPNLPCTGFYFDWLIWIGAYTLNA